MSKIKYKKTIITFISLITLATSAIAGAYYGYTKYNAKNNDNPGKNKDVSLFEDQTIFVRKPFITKFNLANTNKTITTIFNHLDSPGQTTRKDFIEPKPAGNLADSDNKLSNLDNQGAQEVSEFLALKDVLLSQSDNSDLVIYGGDTNIKNENYFLARKFVENNLESTLSTNFNPTNKKLYGERFLTSLGTKGNYANQYDKMFFINNDKTFFNPIVINQTNSTKEFKIDIYKTFRDFVAKNDLKTKPGWDSKYNQMPDNKVIRALVSDHAPVYTDIKLINHMLSSNLVNKQVKLNLTKDINTLRLGHWNILNYGGNEAKAYAIANIIAKSGMDLIGLTEINDNDDSTNLQNLNLIVNYLNQLTNSNKWKVAIQKQVDTNIPNDLLATNQFGKAQIEQVAVIYDSSLFNLVDSTTYNEPIEYFKQKIS
ncbi:hypothetical protein GE118_00360 [Mycoplasma sp. NEAQ87857]|uniref:hypothetical protein n=1 Tax=Mycoplasma sp. NEAQ87857 TaxID=2683967 RepID=UPI001316CFCB|nr:hypothetical protein [Mycoplasma sp. NEAQ87857]QGZ97256.1 hypothetical protein GE118_00360 [Mycoplasma sp. NEAQ87857]